MALWGNKDNLQGPTPVTIAGTASSEFWTATAAGIGTLADTGLTAVLGPNGSAGFVVILGPIDANTVKVSHQSSLTGSYDAVYAEQPMSLRNDPGYAPTSADGSLGRTQKPIGLSSASMDATAGTVWEADHSGWVGVTTYMAYNHETGQSELRVKKEVFVAMSGIQTGNRDYPDWFNSAGSVAVVIGSATVTGSTTPTFGVNTPYTVATPGATAGDLTYLWTTTDGSATISAPTANSTNIGFSTTGSFNVTCTVSSVTATDSPSSDTLGVTVS